MKNEWIIRVLVGLAAVLLAPVLFAQTTLTVKNSTVDSTSVSVSEVSPAGVTVLYTLLQDQAQNTGLPANGNTILGLQMQQKNLNVANTPLLITNVRLADLNDQCFAGIPPCLAMTPASSAPAPGVKEANRFLAERSTTKEFCLPGVLSARKGNRYFALENGLIVRLIGALEKLPADGKTCLCGVVATTPEPLDTIAFDVRGTCSDGKRPRMKKQ
ncbi:MAG TPA: hypothetical protein VF698_06335 [Thermoanaerobaculia bacterium]